MTHPATLRIGRREFAWGARTYIMGVINVSPDSFSGDGLSRVEDALSQARRFVDEGADILDVGGQSTRPGADKTAAGFEEISPEEEIRRTKPVIVALARELPNTPVSIDTYKVAVAKEAFAAGAGMLNDIWGFRAPNGEGPALAALAASHQAPAVIMHNQRGNPAHPPSVDVAQPPSAVDVITTITTGLNASIDIATVAGIPRERLIIDPGFGFGWTPQRNIEMLRRLRELCALELPVLIGTSRKSTIGAVLGGAPVEERLLGTAATVALAIANGADIVRVHDVAAMKHVAIMSDAIVRGWRA
jgi:dihydropteroate synthase